MPKGSIDDQLHSNPKILRLLSEKDGLKALGLWTWAVSWCNAHLTDGHVPEYALKHFRSSKVLASCLIRSGMWIRAESGGFQFHDWEDFNSSREYVLSKRRKDAERKGHSRLEARESKRLVRDVSARTPSVTPSGVDAASSAPYTVYRIPCTDPPGVPQPKVGPSHAQEFDEALRSESFRRNQVAPRVTRDQSRQIVERIAEMRDQHGVSFAAAAAKLVVAALDSGKAFAFAALEIDPYAAPTSKTTRTIGAELEAVRSEASALQEAGDWEGAKPLLKRIDELAWLVKQRGPDYVIR